MGKFWEYLKAVFSHWEPLMSGIFFTLFLLVISWLYTRRPSSAPLPWYYYVFVAFIFLFYACYRTWLDQDQAQEREVQTLKDTHQNSEDLLRQRITDLEDRLTVVKTPTEEQIAAAVNASFISKKVTDSHIESDAVVLTLQHPPIPDSVHLIITTFLYTLRNSTGMSIQGNKIYLTNKPNEFRFFDYLPSEIAEGSVSVEYRRAVSIQSGPSSLSIEIQDRIETFTEYITQGEALIDRYGSAEDSSKILTTQYDRWVAEVKEFLSDCDDSYPARFLNAVTEFPTDSQIATGIPVANYWVYLDLHAQVRFLRKRRKEIREQAD